MRQSSFENNNWYEGVVVEHEPYVLVEGVLDKSKQKDSFLKLPIGRSKAKWVRRYFTLRCSEIPDSFFLDQYSDASSSSKVRKTLDMNRVLQVDTNVSSRDDDRNWIFSIHFSTRCGRSPKNSVLYLAANSEEEMNRWVAQLCYACNLEKQEDSEPYGQAPRPPVQRVEEHNPASVEPRTQQSGGDFFSESFDSFLDTPSSDGSVVERFFDENPVSKSKSDYTLLKHCASEAQRTVSKERIMSSSEGATTQPYIHLKNCTSSRSQQALLEKSRSHQRTCSIGSSASSSQNSSCDSDSAAGDLPSRSSLDVLVPPPRPPKTNAQLHSRRKNECQKMYEVYTNAPCQLNQMLPPPALEEIGFEDDHGWSGETIQAPQSEDSCSLESPTRVPKGYAPGIWKAEVEKRVPDANALPPYTGNLTPPKVDRSCKPHRKEANMDEANNSKRPVARVNSFVKRADKYTNLTPPSPPPSRLNSSSVSPKTKVMVPPIPRTNPLNRLQRDTNKPPIALPTGGLQSSPQLAPKTPTSANSMLEYFDPVEGVTVLRSSSSTSVPPSPKIRPEGVTKTANSVEYVLIDEDSTKAVFEANVRQNELRAMGKPIV